MIPVGGVDQDAVAIVPTGTVTFVLTDVERSTLLWEERGEVMAGVMARCHDLLAETMRRVAGCFRRSRARVTVRSACSCERRMRLRAHSICSGR